MSRSFHTVAAAAVTLSFVSIGAASSGARAEVQAPQPALIAAPIQNEAMAPGPRFVAEPVVQPLAQSPAIQAPSLAQLVHDMPEADLSGDMKCLAEAVYFEARGEPLDGQLAVAEVVINRTQSGRYPTDYCSVVTQPAQFSFVRRGVIPRPDIASTAWAKAKAVAQIAHQDMWNSEAKDALFFHAASVRPSWARAKTTLARLDTHIFYR